jgi:hypothetical protein
MEDGVSEDEKCNDFLHPVHHINLSLVIAHSDVWSQSTEWPEQNTASRQELQPNFQKKTPFTLFQDLNFCDIQ